MSRDHGERERFVVALDRIRRRRIRRNLGVGSVV